MLAFEREWPHARDERVYRPVPFARESGNGWDFHENTITIGVILFTVTRSIWHMAIILFVRVDARGRFT